MRPLFVWWIALGTAVGPAWAQPLEVACGSDLDTWQQLEHQRLTGADAVAAYRAFVEAYPSSPLAEAAWGRLVDLGHGQPWVSAVVPADAIDAVVARYDAHQRGATLALTVDDGADDTLATR